jgi:hypothetical protein
MSAIGSYVRLRTADLDRCLELASRRAESSLDAFSREWASAVLEEVVFEGSGHLLSSYFLAQGAVNGLDDPFDSAEGTTLARVFTAAFPARAAHPLPEFNEEALRQFCEAEWGGEGPSMCDGIAAAHAFFKAGMAHIRGDQVVVFIVS